jgi:tRNA (guanine37-N1)-methyltransferase
MENVRHNKVVNRVTIIEGDAFDTSLLPLRKFDRAIIPTPYGMDTIFDTIAVFVKTGGMIHFYTFKNRNQADRLVQKFQQKGFPVIKKRHCGNVAPGVSRFVFDLVKREKDA